VGPTHEARRWKRNFRPSTGATRVADAINRVYEIGTKVEHASCEAVVNPGHRNLNTLEELRALEREIEREWWWLNGALHAAAQARAERPYADPRSFREMQAQVREVDKQRVQIAVRIAEIEATAERENAGAMDVGHS